VMRRGSVVLSSTLSATLGFVALGVVLRVLQYSIPRSLWFDEARNAAEILKDHWWLMLPPHSAQPTPFGFLWLERGVVALLGEGELALRLFPLLAGLGALAVAARLAHQSLRGWAAPLAVAMLALSAPAVYFSTEVKQYSSDLLVGLLIALAFANYQSSEKALRAVLFGLLGALAVWISYTSVFYLAVAGTMLVVRRLHRRDWRGSVLCVGMGSMWLASFALHYRVAISHWSQTQWLTAHWSAGFPREGEGFLATVEWSASSLVAAFNNPLGVTLGGTTVAALAGLMFLAGVVRSGLAGAEASGSRGTIGSADTTAAEGRGVGDSVLGLFAGVFALTFVCALLHVYPFDGRLLLFLLPSMAFLVAHGVCWPLAAGAASGAGLRTRILPAGALALTAALLAGDASSAWRLAKLESLHRHGTVNLARPQGGKKGFEGVSEVVRYVARNYQPGDSVYLYYSAEPGYSYYARRLDFQVPTTTGVRAQGDYPSYAADLDALSGLTRVWVVFSHTVIAEKDFFVRHLDGLGRRLDYYHRPRADAYLFNLAQPADQSGQSDQLDQLDQPDESDESDESTGRSGD